MIEFKVLPSKSKETCDECYYYEDDQELKEVRLIEVILGKGMKSMVALCDRHYKEYNRVLEEEDEA